MLKSSECLVGPARKEKICIKEYSEFPPAEIRNSVLNVLDKLYCCRCICCLWFNFELIFHYLKKKI